MCVQPVIEAGTHHLQRGIIRNDTIWDALVFGKIQKSVGGRLKMIITGSAPITNEVMEFAKVALGCVVMEGVHDVLYLKDY